MAVRSLNFAKGVTGTPGFLGVYIVPAGHTAIVKDVRLVDDSGSISTLSWGVYTPSAATWVLRRTNVPALSSVEDKDSFTVAEPGEGLFISSNQSGVYYCLSGALLVGVV